MESQRHHAKSFSFEFFPPKSAEAAAILKNTLKKLAPLKPQFFSVTYGAGGSTRDHTFETVMEIQHETGIGAAPHLSCIGSTQNNIREVLAKYRAHGIKRIVALRGDMPSGMQDAGELHYANELVSFIRQESGDHFHIEIAAYPEVHPQATNALTDFKNFKKKVDAGANSALTQYFYNPQAYFHFVASCEQAGIDMPIVPGIMPISNYTQLARFSDACGAEIPRWIRKRLEAYGDDMASIRAFGLDITTELCTILLEQGAPGLHFYTMNKAEATLSIWKRLGLNT